MGLIIAIIILGIAIAVVAYFLLRSILVPKRVDSLQSLLKQGKHQSVIKAAKQLVQKDSRNADAHYLLGMAYEQDDKQELALMELKIVNDIGNFDGVVDEPSFRKKIAELYLKFNQAEEALKEYLLLLKREPQNADYYFLIGKIFEDRNRTDKAGGYYKKAVELNPRNAEAHTRLGLILYRAKRAPEARSELDLAVRTQPENYEAWYYIGKILKDNRDCIAAMSAFEKASRAQEFKAKSLVERGGCLISMGSFERAVSELERAIKIAKEGTNEDLYSHYFLAHCHEKMRHIERAVEHWEYIYSKKRNFRDVAEKLGKYQELRTDDRLKDFLTIAHDEFIAVCERVTVVMGLDVRDTRNVEGGCEIIAVENTSKWRNARAMPKLIRFLRVTDTIDESSVRDAHEAMRKENITRGLIVTSSTFSRLAQEYAENRPIDLHNKEKLQSLLQQVEM